METQNKTPQIKPLVFFLLFLFALYATSQAQRDPYKWPFASTSIWNMPIHKNAVFAPANLEAAPRNFAYASLSNPDLERIVMTPTAPLTTINYSTAGWSGASRCNATGGANYGLPISVPMPTNYVIPSDNSNAGAAFLESWSTFI